MANLELNFLGGFSLRQDGRPLPELKTQKGLALLCYLAVTRQPASRAALAGLFWPDRPDADAHMNLRKVLVRLKPLSPYLRITRASLAFDPNAPLRLDVAEFETAASARNDVAALQRASDLFQGDFLDGFYLSDAPFFDEWVLAQRARLRTLALGALEILIAHFASQDGCEFAIRYARRLLTLEPWHEETHRALMRLLALSGQRSAALVQFETCRGILANELGAELSPATVELHEQIQSGGLAGLDAGRAEPKHNLPTPVTRFFGREPEIAQIIERLGENRLVTLTGPGGVGKTRLVLQTSQRVLDNFADGVWLVELAPLSDFAWVPQQVAATLGLRDEPGQPILKTLTTFLTTREVLLVFDNCEHLLPACGHLADSLLRACPRLRLMAASREPLGITGEAVFTVPSLSFPDPDHLPAVERMTDYTAVSLLLDRARLVLPNYQVTVANAPSMARICQRLDGIPLALEMAAARLSILNAGQLASRLDDAFRVLTGGSRSALPRQQTLRATIDWSYQLLNEAERRLLQHLAVFADSCSLEAAEAVCSDANLAPGNILDHLASLVAKSLVIADRQSGEEPRYHLLETVRQYAREKLDGSGELVSTHTHHRDYFLRFAETNFPKTHSNAKLIWKKKLATELENIRSALEWSFKDMTDVNAGPRLISALISEYPWASYQEPAKWFKEALAWRQKHPNISDQIYASLLGRGSALLSLDEPQTALTGLTEAINLSRRLGRDGRKTLMVNLFTLASQYLQLHTDTLAALAPLAEAEAILLELGPDGMLPDNYFSVLADFVSAKAALAYDQEHYQDAKALASESIRLFEDSGDRWCAVDAYWRLGEASLKLEQHEQARVAFQAALTLIDETGHPSRADALRRLGTVDWQQGQLERGLDYCRTSIQLAATLIDYNVIASCLGVCAGIAAKAGQPARAARLAGASAALWTKQNRKPWEDSSLDTILPGWRDGPDAATLTAGFEAGRAMRVDEAMAYARGDAAA